MVISIKLILLWLFGIFIIEYHLICIALSNLVLGLLYHEYQGIFKQICSAQTGHKEATYIERLSSSIFPYILNQIMILSSSFSSDSPEQVLGICFILSSSVLISLRINQYSSLCSEITEYKRKKKKIVKTRDEDL
jgi:hypothetical protein